MPNVIDPLHDILEFENFIFENSIGINLYPVFDRGVDRGANAVNGRDIERM